MNAAALPNIVERHPEAYSVSIARYAKGKYIITTRDGKDGFRGAAGVCAADLNLKYVNRSRGYTASAAQVRRFETAYHERATPSFERWLDGYPVLTNDLSDILAQVRIQVDTDNGLKVVRYSRNGKPVRSVLLGDDDSARRLYEAATWAPGA